MTNPAENVRQIEGPTSRLPVQSETGAVVSMFERMARDPSVPMDRIERVMDMMREMRREQAEEDFNNAMAATQRDLTPVARDSFNPQTRSKYASYHAIDKAIRPVYTRHDLGVSFDEDANAPDGFIRVLAFVSKGRHSKTFHYDSPIVTQGLAGKTMMTLTHARASAVTYAKRYLVGMIFNLSTGEDDDDGRAAGQAEDGAGTITAEQAADIKAKCDQVAAGFDGSFCNYFKISTIAELPAKDYQRALAALKKKGVQ
jgi:hypothetical protein